MEVDSSENVLSIEFFSEKKAYVSKFQSQSKMVKVNQREAQSDTCSKYKTDICTASQAWLWCLFLTLNKFYPFSLFQLMWYAVGQIFEVLKHIYQKIRTKLRNLKSEFPQRSNNFSCNDFLEEVAN